MSEETTQRALQRMINALAVLSRERQVASLRFLAAFVGDIQVRDMRGGGGLFRPGVDPPSEQGSSPLQTGGQTRGQTEHEEGLTPSNTVGNGASSSKQQKKGGGRKREARPPTPDETRVVDAVNAAWMRKHPSDPPPYECAEGTVKVIRAALKKHTVSDLLLVVEWYPHKWGPNGWDPWSCFNLTTPFKPEKLPNNLAAARAWKAKQRPASQRKPDTSAADFERRLATEDPPP